jgi:hypothetical protein
MRYNQVIEWRIIWPDYGFRLWWPKRPLYVNERLSNAVMQQHSYPCHCIISHDLASNLSLRIKLFRALYCDGEDQAKAQRYNEVLKNTKLRSEGVKRACELIYSWAPSFTWRKPCRPEAKARFVTFTQHATQQRHFCAFATAFSTIQEHAKYNGGSIEVCTQDAEFELDELDELDELV